MYTQHVIEFPKQLERFLLNSLTQTIPEEESVSSRRLGFTTLKKYS